MSTSLCSRGYAFDADVFQRQMFAARMVRVKLGALLRRRGLFADVSDETAGEMATEALGLGDLEIAGVSEMRIYELADAYADTTEPAFVPTRTSGRSN